MTWMTPRRASDVRIFCASLDAQEFDAQYETSEPRQDNPLEFSPLGCDDRLSRVA